MEIKYLKQLSQSTKAPVYITYLETCDFDTTLERHSISKFSEHDIQSMVRIGQDHNGTEEVR